MGLVKWRFKGVLCFSISTLVIFFDREELGNIKIGYES